MPKLSPFLLDNAGGEVLNVVGDYVRILADGTCTNNQCVVFEEIAQPGGGPPLHTHDLEDEFFFVIEGTVKFSVDGKESIVGPGGFVCATRGSIHTFKNIGATPSRMIISCTPAGLEIPFREAARLPESELTPERLTEIFGRAGIRFVGPPLD